MIKEFLGEDNDEVEICKDNKKQVRLNRWNKENYLNIEYKREEDCRFIKKDRDNFEILITLKEKPKTNKFIYHLKGWEEFNFSYQPELTKEEKEKGAKRPDNVVGSYAVYHKTKRDHVVGQTNYKTGKAFHIYRPKIIDNNGDWIWGKMNVNDGKLTITINQDWLDNAGYPVIIDPDFGYTAIGGTSYSIAREQPSPGDDRRRGSAWAMPASGGTANYIRAYIGGDTAIDVKAIINQKDSGGVGTHGQIAGPVENVACAAAFHWEEFTLSDEALTEAVVYILNVVGDMRDLGPFETYYVKGDVNGAVASYLDSAEFTYSSPENPWVDTADATTLDLSIYCNYTEVAVGTNMKINISDVFKDIESLKINIGNVWKDVVQVLQNIGGVWKNVFG